MNRLFSGLILVSLAAAFVGSLLGGTDLLTVTSTAMFRSAELAVEVCLGLIGVLTLWSGLFQVAERSGLTDRLAHALTPLMGRLMPGTRQHPESVGPVSLNLSANMLGLDNAATPLGLKAMESLERHNATPGTASNDQIMFLVLNTSSVTLVPVTVFMFRAQQGAADPADIYLPLLISTTVSTFFGVWFTARRQGTSLRHPLVLAVAGIWLLLLGLLALVVALVSSDQAAAISSLLGNGLLLGVVGLFLVAGLRAGDDVYNTFIEGAREGFHMAVRIIPYLVAMLVAIGMLRASGVLDMALDGVRLGLAALGADTRFVDALPVALLKPLSGSGARAMMVEVMQTHGVDSLAGRMAAVMQGSTETTFYVLAVYFGSSGIARVRHAISCGLVADLAGLCTAVLVSYLFFG